MLKKHERQALEFLNKQGSDQIGVIDNEDKLAAAMVFEDLKIQGYVYSLKTLGGPTYYLTEKGKKVLQDG